MDAIVIAVFVIYFAAVLCIGFYFWNKNKNLSDYTLGNRSLSPFMAALSAQASDMSGWLILGLPGSILAGGIGGAWVGIGLAIGSYAAWLIISKRIRIYSQVSGNSLTLPEFFKNRFKDKSGKIEIFCSVILIVFFLFYVTSGFVAGGNVFVMIFGGEVDYKLGVLITAAVIVVYTCIGGFKAVCTSDLIQGIMMLIAVVIVPIAGIMAISGGWDGATQTITDFNPDFFDIFKFNGETLSFAAILSSLAWGLGYFGMPHIIVRYMAIENPNDTKVARRVGAVWMVVALTSAIMIGVVGLAWSLQTMGTVPDNPEMIFILMVSGLFVPIVIGILYAGLMGAVISSADSQLMVASSSVTNSIVTRFGKSLTDAQLMKCSRIFVVVIAVIAAILAMDPESVIMDLTAFSWAGLGATFGPVVICALFYKRTNRTGVFAGMITGFVTVVLWNTFLRADGIIPGIFGADWCIFDTGVFEILPAFLLALAVIVIVSRLTEPPEQEICEEFDKAAV